MSLNKIQKKILNYLKEAQSKNLKYEELLEKLGITSEEILSDIEILGNKDFIIIQYSGGNFPSNLKITPEGMEKLRDNSTTQLHDFIHNNPWSVITTLITIFIAMISIIVASNYYSENIALQKQILDLQNHIKEENELKQTMPPTIWLTQEFRNGSSGELEIIPTLYFKKNSDRLFTISHYEVNFTLNGKQAGRGGGYELKFKNEGINEGKIVFSSVYPPSINEYNFFHGINDLVIDYILEIRDMDSQIIYRGNVTTEINSSSNVLKFPSGNEPVIFSWTKT